MNKSTITLTLTAILLFSLIANVSAITGRLGNSRMILNLDEGETIERYILIQNHNDVPLTIDLEPVGELADSVELNEESFVLQPGDEKKAYFTITADKPGTTETKINVRFTPEEGSGVGLSSTIIVVAPGENQNTDDDDGSFFDFLSGDNSDDDSDDSSDEDPNVNIDIGNNPDLEPQTSPSVGMSTPMILTISTIILVVVFIALLVYASSRSKTKSKKRSGRPRA
jgi:ABC-type maltose transport system permease subunit